MRRLIDNYCLILNNLEKNYCQAGKPGDGFALTHSDKVEISTLRRKPPRPRPWALAQDFAPRAYWKVSRDRPWGSTESLQE